MKKPLVLATLIALFASVSITTPTLATTGRVRVTVAKAGLIVGAGGGKGILAFRHRNYPFIVQGLSVGLTTGASISKLVGRADSINEVGDFAGTYTVIGGGVALIGGTSVVRLRNAKGVTLTLEGPKGGFEISANISRVMITLDVSHSTPD